MKSNSNNKRIAWMYHNSPTLGSYIEQRLNKINNNQTNLNYFNYDKRTK